MDYSILRNLTLFGGSVILGSIVVDTLRFTPWKDNHDILVPVLVLAGLAVTFVIGWLAGILLRRKQ